MSIDALYSKTYDKNAYNCAHLVADAWELVTGNSIQEALAVFLVPAKLRTAPASLRERFVRHDKPVSPCVVLMRRANTPPHVGMYYNGRVIHITEVGVQYQPLDVVSRGFTNVGYYTC